MQTDHPTLSPTTPLPSREKQKQSAALAAIDYISPHTIIGVGTGSTVHWFIQSLGQRWQLQPGWIKGAVSSSQDTSNKLAAFGIPLFDLNEVDTLPLYIDGADEVDPDLHLIKGGGGALTREKIIAAAADTFICITDESKYKPQLGKFPIPIEVIPMARQFVIKHIAQSGGQAIWREGFISDNEQIILDIHYLSITHPRELETLLNQIPGVVTAGLFAHRPADRLLLGTAQGVSTLLRKNA